MPFLQKTQHNTCPLEKTKKHQNPNENIHKSDNFRRM